MRTTLKAETRELTAIAVSFATKLAEANRLEIQDIQAELYHLEEVLDKTHQAILMVLHA
jgi:hypothetical protein